ncbi:MAG: type II toxin-antitoxin system HicB family antitoxin [Planctomycetes bacterium]|nr:type II toxin-antitoxin system HicB family antitoxin [Planctomycetota bacterium]
MMGHKGYIAKVEFDSDAGVFHGEVVNTRDVITFEGRSVEELNKAFKDSVADYLAFCAARGEEPEKRFSGKFVIRLSPELHRKVLMKARLSDKSLSNWVSEVLKEAVEAQ